MPPCAPPPPKCGPNCSVLTDYTSVVFTHTLAQCIPFKEVGKVDEFRECQEKLFLGHRGDDLPSHVRWLHCRLRVSLLQRTTLPHHASVDEQRAHTGDRDTRPSRGKQLRPKRLREIEDSGFGSAVVG